MANSRSCGVLLHVSSLPSKHGLGDFGPQAYEFVDFLVRADQSVWQMLPLTPINAGAGNSPYSSYSAFAGNILFISPDLLVREGLLSHFEVMNPPSLSVGRVDYEAAAAWRMHLLEQAFDSAFPRLRTDERFMAFCASEEEWLETYCLFMALKREHKYEPWYAWPKELRLRDPEALAAARERLGFWIMRERYLQYLFCEQWHALRAYCRERDVQVMGDAPIYVSLDSCDVWSNRELFVLDNNGLPVFCAGAPPDYFSETGQMWGNPVYDWDMLEQSGYAWWIKRLRQESRRYDLLRLDHFRGFCAFWQVPACELTAENGVWIDGPGARLFHAVMDAVPELQLVAEDLGVITQDVTELMAQFGFPGMKVLQFAFSEDMGANAYIPHNIIPGCVVYTGTHDNATTRGWFADDLDDEGRTRVCAYLGRTLHESEAADALIRVALSSVAELSIIPVQDYLNLGASGRMNIPGIAGGNWGWRCRDGDLSTELAERMRKMSWMYGRSRK